jgi:hypothetical protein
LTEKSATFRDYALAAVLLGAGKAVKGFRFCLPKPDLF